MLFLEIQVNPFKVGEEVFLSLDEKDVKVLND